MADSHALLAERYGLDLDSTEALPGYDDTNLKVTTRSGERFLFKVSAPGVGRERLEAQNAALACVEQRAPELVVPRLVRTGDAEELSAFEGRFARLFTWVDGEVLAKIPAPTPQLFESLGGFLARLDQALDGFSHPGVVRAHDWNLLELSRVAADLGAVEDPWRRRMLEHLLLELELSALPGILRLPTGVIHNDANEFNVLVDRDGKLAGLIDFEDLTESVLVGELAVAAAYAMLGRDDPLAVAAAIVKGYHARLPLASAEFDALYPLICGRLLLSVLHSSRASLRNPDNEYIKISQAPAWRLIERLLGTHPEAAAARFRRACGLSDGLWLPACGAIALEQRRDHLSSSLSLHYEQPLKLCRGVMQKLFDEDGRAYLDLVNNVCHVGHSNPQVVRAAARQMARLNTNTRYLHDALNRYASRLAARLPAPLEVCFLVCSGSEANELALRLAARHTGRRELLVVDHAYHGNTGTLVAASPYKFNGPGGAGRPDWVDLVPAPDTYRGAHRGEDAAWRYATSVEERLKLRPVGAFLCESLMSCAGQVIPPSGYLKRAYQAVRNVGGLCIADEVQVGFGRAGSHFWGFETQEVVPDIVTLGKPIGNGHPLAAVVTTREIASSFESGMEYFNTFGGNPVSCAVGLAVLDVIEEQGLQERAQVLGERLKSGLAKIDHPLIGDVRGQGLFLGVELVRNRQTLAPAPKETSQLIERMRQSGILLSSEGPLKNVLKIKPPLVISEADVDQLLAEFAIAIAEIC